MAVGCGKAEQVVRSIARMNRAQIQQSLKRFQGRFKMDFTEDYLASVPLDKLRHILFAASMYRRGN